MKIKLLILAVVFASAANSLDRVSKIGSYGGKGEMNRITDFNYDGRGNIYFVDASNHKILKFSPEGKLLLKFGNFGAVPGTMNSPARLTIDPQGNIYVLDYHDLNLETDPKNKIGYYRITKYDPGGNYIFDIGGTGKGDGEFYSMPNDIECDNQGNLYVLDYGNYRVQKFDPDGNFILKFGSFGKMDGQFDYPNTIAFDKSGFLYIVDTNNHRIQKFDRSGKFILKFGREGYNDGEFYYPYKLYLDNDNRISVITSYSFYTSNKRRYIKCLIQKFDLNGKFQKKIYAVERYYDDDTYYYLDILNGDKNDNLLLVHSRDKSVLRYKIVASPINWGSMSKNYYLELRKPADINDSQYQSTGYSSDGGQHLYGWNPIQTVNLNYDLNERTNIDLQNTLSYARTLGPKTSLVNSSATSLETTRDSLYSDSYIRVNHIFDRTKNKNVSYTIGYYTQYDKYDWINNLSTKEAQDYRYDRVYGNINLDVSDFSDVELGYNKYLSRTGYNSDLSNYISNYSYFNDYYYLKYHADF